MKDLGVNAIKDGDWMLPQTILSGIYQLMHNSTEKECPIAAPHDAFKTFFWFAQHFRRIAIRNADHISINVLYGYHLDAYDWLVQQQIKDEGYLNWLDKQHKDFAFSIIQSKDFSDVRDHLVRDYLDIIIQILQQLKMTDEELPTDEYHYSLKEVKSYESDYKQFWHYLSHYSVSTLTDIINYAIQQKDERVYDGFQSKIWNFFDRIEKCSLTEFQKLSFLKDAQFRFDGLNEVALEHNLQKEIVGYMSHIYIGNWIKKGWRVLYWPALLQMASVIIKLIRTNKSYTVILDEFFMIGRVLANDSINQKDKIEIMGYIVEKGMKWLEGCDGRRQLKYDLQYQLNWLFKSFIKDNASLEELKEKIELKINELIEGFDYSQYPDYLSY